MLDSREANTSLSTYHLKLIASGSNLAKSCQFSFSCHEPCRQQRYGDSSCYAGSARVDATRPVTGDVRFTVQRFNTPLHIYSRVNENNGRLQLQIRIANAICVNITGFGRGIPFFPCSRFWENIVCFYYLQKQASSMENRPNWCARSHSLFISFLRYQVISNFLAHAKGISKW